MSSKRRENPVSPSAGGGSVAASNALDSRDIVLRLEKLVREAAKEISLYQDLYGHDPRVKSLSDFEKLPIVNKDTFTKLGDVSKTVCDPWDMVGPFAPWKAEGNRFPLPVLHDDTDEESLIERLRWIMQYIGSKTSERIAFLVSHRHQYGAAELVDLLIYLRFQCQIFQVTRQPRGHLARLLKEAGAATVFVGAEPELLPEEWPESISTIVTFNHPKELKGKFRHFDILHLDEIPLLAVRQQPNPYTWLQDHFYLEESAIKTLIVTTLSHVFGPFIRYDTGIRARLNGHNLFLADDLV